LLAATTFDVLCCAKAGDGLSVATSASVDAFNNSFIGMLR